MWLSPFHHLLPFFNVLLITLNAGASVSAFVAYDFYLSKYVGLWGSSLSFFSCEMTTRWPESDSPKCHDPRMGVKTSVWPHGDWRENDSAEGQERWEADKCIEDLARAAGLGCRKWSGLSYCMLALGATLKRNGAKYKYNRMGYWQCKSASLLQKFKWWPFCKPLRELLCLASVGGSWPH